MHPKPVIQHIHQFVQYLKQTTVGKKQHENVLNVLGFHKPPEHLEIHCTYLWNYEQNSSKAFSLRWCFDDEDDDSGEYCVTCWSKKARSYNSCMIIKFSCTMAEDIVILK